MAKRIALAAALAGLIAGCGGTPAGPAAPSPAASLAHTIDDAAGQAGAIGPGESLDITELLSAEQISAADLLALAAMPDTAAPETEEVFFESPDDHAGVVELPLAGASPDTSGATPAAVGPPSVSVSVDPERATATVSWTKGFGSTPTYWQVRFTRPGGAPGAPQTVPGLRTSLTQALSIEGTWTVEVRACDAAGCSAYSPKSFGFTARLPPGKPAVRASVQGTTITVNWTKPTSGGAPTSYIVIFKGDRQSAGLSPSKSWSGVAPGVYLIAVLAKNAWGEGPAATVQVTVKGGEGVYKGAFNGKVTIRKKGTVCSWLVTYAGDITITLKGGGASITIVGTWVATNPTPADRCTAGDGRINTTTPAAISGTKIARTNINLDLAKGTFSGNLSGSTITGTLTAEYKYGTGIARATVTLNKAG